MTPSPLTLCQPIRKIDPTPKTPPTPLLEPILNYPRNTIRLGPVPQHDAIRLVKRLPLVVSCQLVDLLRFDPT